MTAAAMPAPAAEPGRHGGYKWIALSNTTIGMLMATINSSIVLISLPAIFRGIGLDPLESGNVSYLLWMLMGYMVVTAVLVVSLGRIGDMFGRVRMYDLGFAIFTVFSILLSLVFWQGPAAALTLIVLRVLQAVGGAMIMANSAAIITDAFPSNQRGMALGINSVAALAGAFVGLVVGGLLSTINWHAVFLVSVPVGLFGTIWAYLKLREIGTVRRSGMDWWGNLTFAAGLIALLTGITYGIQPYGSSNMGWTNPMVLAAVAGGVVLLVAFVVIEARVAEPMFRLSLFRRRAFAFGNLAGLLASVGRGGLMFMLIIWLQGIWLPLHGYNYEDTPFWSAIYMLPLTAGFLIAGPVSGLLSDRYGARIFATGGMLAAAAAFGLLLLLPADFSYPPFAALIFSLGLSMGLFASPNSAGIMNSVPPEQRGVAAGMQATFQNAGMNLSIGLFFSLIVVGLSNSLPGALLPGLTAQGVPVPVATRIAHLPPVATLFAAFLGYNPMRTLLGPILAMLPPDRAANLTSHTFFPDLIQQPFMNGMHITFVFAGCMVLLAALASWLRGGRYVHGETPGPAPSARRSQAGPGARAAAGAHGEPPVVTVTADGAHATAVAAEVARRLGVRLVDLTGDSAQLVDALRAGLASDGRPVADLAALLARLAATCEPEEQRALTRQLQRHLLRVVARSGVVMVARPLDDRLQGLPRSLHVHLLASAGEDGRYQLALDPARLPAEASVEAIVAAARVTLDGHGAEPGPAQGPETDHAVTRPPAAGPTDHELLVRLAEALRQELRARL